MKEKEVHLTVEEIDYLLKGSIHWEDIQSRIDLSSRKPIDLSKIKDSPELDERVGLQEKKEKSSESSYFVLNPITSQSRPFLEGNKVYWVLSGVGLITIGTWAYFVFAK